MREEGARDERVDVCKGAHRYVMYGIKRPTFWRTDERSIQLENVSVFC